MYKETVFVFGSNLAGRHGKGSALHARRHHGAVQGCGWGRQGNSYAIPTKDKHLAVLPLEAIKDYVDAFLDYADFHPETLFMVEQSGVGLQDISQNKLHHFLLLHQKTFNYPINFYRIHIIKSNKMFNFSYDDLIYVFEQQNKTNEKLRENQEALEKRIRKLEQERTFEKCPRPFESGY